LRAASSSPPRIYPELPWKRLDYYKLWHFFPSFSYRVSILGYPLQSFHSVLVINKCFGAEFSTVWRLLTLYRATSLCAQRLPPPTVQSHQRCKLVRMRRRRSRPATVRKKSNRAGPPVQHLGKRLGHKCPAPRGGSD